MAGFSGANVTGLGNSGKIEGCWGGGVTGEASLLGVQKRCGVKWAVVQGPVSMTTNVSLALNLGVVVFLFVLS